MRADIILCETLARRAVLEVSGKLHKAKRCISGIRGIVKGGFHVCLFSAKNVSYLACCHDLRSSREPHMFNGADGT